MKILIYTLLLLSALLGLLVGGLSALLGWILCSSIASSDVRWGWGFMLFGFSYLAHPYLIYWLFGKGFNLSALGVAGFFILCSVGLMLILPSAIEASARP